MGAKRGERLQPRPEISGEILPQTSVNKVVYLWTRMSYLRQFLTARAQAATVKSSST